MFLKFLLAALAVVLQLAQTDFQAEAAAIPPCDLMCMMIYAPVCGSDGKTYGNSCSLTSFNCGVAEASMVTLAHTGEC